MLKDNFTQNSGSYKKLYRITIRLFCFLLITSTFHIVLAQGGDWIEKEPTPTQGGFGEAIVGTGDHIYAIRAHSTGTCRFWRYNPANDTWTTLLEWTPPTPIPRPKSGTAMAWDEGNNIYVLFGGSQTDTNRTYFYRYHIPDRKWERLADTPHIQGAGDALAWSGYDGKVYGFLGSQYHGSSFDCYDPDYDSWTTLNLHWSTVDDGASLAWTGAEYLYALRGEWEETIPHADFAKYDISFGTWDTMSPVPVNNGVGDGASLLWIGDWATHHSNSIFALSGNDVLETPGYNFFSYDIISDSWIEWSPVPYPVGYYTGNRLGSASKHIYYWQGSPSTWEGGGDRFAMINGQPIIEWIMVRDSKGVRLDPGGEVPRGLTIRLCTRVSDFETPPWDIIVTFNCGNWIMPPPIYNYSGNYWYMDCIIPHDAVIGSYDVRVNAEDQDGNVDSLTDLGEFVVIEEQIHECILEFKEGWNLIGVPLTPLESSIESVFDVNLSNVEAIYSYWHNSWYSWFNGVPSTLTELECGKGYWVSSKLNFTITLRGTITQMPSIVYGLYLMGVNSSSTIVVEDFISQMPFDISYIFGFDNERKEYIYWVSVLPEEYQTLKIMYSWKGYWIYYENN